jgi:hypothetical protein
MEPSVVRPFKRTLIIDPYILPMDGSTTPIPVQIGKTALAAANVTSFKMQNPNPFWVWFRGWTGSQSPMATPYRKGHFIAPGATEIYTSQLPDWIACIPEARPGFETHIDGVWRYSNWDTYLVLTYGSGS